MMTGLLALLAMAATFEPENLKRVTSMRVVVENIPGAEKIGLDVNLVQAEVETTLRQGGIKVTQIAGMLPYLYLQATVLPLPDGCVVYSLQTSLRTAANLADSKKPVMGELWSQGSLKTRCPTGKKDKVDAAKSVRESIIEEANQLVHDIRSVNSGG